MTDQKVNIVSSNEPFARLLVLELDRMDIPAIVTRTPLAQYPLYILDLDGDMRNAKSLRGNVIGFSKSIAKVGPSTAARMIAVLERPFPMLQFRRIVLEHFVSCDTKQSIKMQDGKETMLHIDRKMGTASIGSGKPLPLTPAEFAILEALDGRRPEPLGKKEAGMLLGAAGETNLYEVHICALRKKIAAQTDIKMIFTLRGKGYYLK